jgi:CDP-glucose 4,6-dehydratase
MRSALVTGAGGFLGAALVRRLGQDGVEVTAPRRPEGDVTDLSSMTRALARSAHDTVFHLAARSTAADASRSPEATWEVNVRGTWTVLEACRAHGVARTVVVTSDRAYGRQEAVPVREDAALLARAPYDVSKAAADLIARSYWPGCGLPVATARLTNVFGPGDRHRSRLVPDAAAAAVAGRRPVIRSDGTPERDFLFVDDAVAALLAIARALDGEGARGEAFNAGAGRSHAVRDVAGRICALAGTGVEPDVRGAPAPPDRQAVDTAKLRDLTGWTPAVGLDEGLERTVEWYRNHPSALVR